MKITINVFVVIVNDCKPFCDNYTNECVGDRHERWGAGVEYHERWGAGVEYHFQEI